MSGGAGKVYFVLYLAVVLELLIIIVERDEAEESLHQKQKETMRIVESILSQLQSGSGSEGINTRPQDEITIPPPGMDLKEVIGTEIKPYRKYIVEVGVTDISGEILRKDGESEKEHINRLKTLVKLGNVEEIEYQIFYSALDDPHNASYFPTDRELKANNINLSEFQMGQFLPPIGAAPEEVSSWQLLGEKTLKLDNEKTFDQLDPAKPSLDDFRPVYPVENIAIDGDPFIPDGMPSDSSFFYSNEETSKKRTSAGAEIKKRCFVVNFQPHKDKGGWYKLRFSSRTNQILGVRSEVSPEDIKDDITVNIGTVQLTVKDLNKVKKQLQSSLEKWGLPTYEMLVKEGDVDRFDEMLVASKQKAAEEPDASEIISKINLYGYIVKLLAPGQSISFDQNKGSIEFNIHVIKPDVKISNPVITARGEVHRFDAVEAKFKFTISPWQGAQNVITGKVLDFNSKSEIADLSFELANSEIQPQQGRSAEYIGTVDRLLKAAENGPRKYEIKLRHNIGTRSSDTTVMLYLYPTTIEDKVRMLENIFSSRAYYGKSLIFNFQPPSGNKILPDEFCYYFKTDADAQPRDCLPGYSATINDGLEFPANAKSASLRIVWNDPITNKQIDVFPLSEVKIKQEEPIITSTRVQTNTTGSEERVRVRVSGISVIMPMIGSEDPSQQAQLNVSVADVQLKVKGYKNTKPRVSNKGNQYTLDFELIGSLPMDAEGVIRGTADIKLIATAVNPLNGAVSEPYQKTIPIRIAMRVDEDQGY